MFLRSVIFCRDKISNEHTSKYPLNILSFQNLDKIDFTSYVTFFVGENGSGKSTLLEAIAYQCEFNTAGGGKNNYYDSYSSKAELGNYIRLSWMPKITTGFFLRAESFFNFASYLDKLANDSSGYDVYAAYGGRSLHEQSHGESFLTLFSNRFNKSGIYLLDEPEAALSPARQLAFLRILMMLEKESKSQFIIVTHSPILLGYPNAQIINFDTSPASEILYEETDHYVITKRFLQDRYSFLDKIFD